MRDGGCYGHVDGPRFNTKAEIRALAAAGVTAVSQTAGPETVLAGEAELPFALMGYATDYANGVQPEPTPVERLLELIAASTESFARVLAAAAPKVEEAALAPSESSTDSTAPADAASRMRTPGREASATLDRWPPPTPASGTRSRTCTPSAPPS